VTDDKDLLMKAYAEIARLNTLLKQALRNGDKGNESNRKSIDRSDSRNSGDENHRVQRSRSQSTSFNSVAQSVAAATYYATGKNPQGIKSANLVLFEDNEKLRLENKKMRQALEWSIKLGKKKRANSMDFHTAPVDEIVAYRHILNSIDLTPVTAISPHIVCNLHNNSNNNSSKKANSNREEIEQGALTRLKSHSEQKRRTVLRFSSPLSAGIASSDVMKKKVRGASICLPAVYRSQKELNYLEYITSSNRAGQPLRGTVCDSYDASPYMHVQYMVHCV
jgi:hypothetical protein